MMRDFLEKHKDQISIVKYVFIVMLVSIVSIYFYLESKNNEITYWKNKYAQSEKVVMLKEDLYEGQVEENKSLKIDNKVLNQRLEERNAKVNSYIKLVAKYEKEIGWLKTKPADTVYIAKVDSIPSPQPGDRVFSHVGDGLVVSGWFQPYDPYNIYFNSLSLSLMPEIIIAKDNNDVWFATIDTKNKYLSIRDIDIKVKAPREKFVIFAGGDVAVNLSSWQVYTGVTVGRWSPYIGYQLASEPSFKLGLIVKLIEF